MKGKQNRAVRIRSSRSKVGARFGSVGVAPSAAGARGRSGKRTSGRGYAGSRDAAAPVRHPARPAGKGALRPALKKDVFRLIRAGATQKSLNVPPRSAA